MTSVAVLALLASFVGSRLRAVGALVGPEDPVELTSLRRQRLMISEETLVISRRLILAMGKGTLAFHRLHLHRLCLMGWVIRPMILAGALLGLPRLKMTLERNLRHLRFN